LEVVVNRDTEGIFVCLKMKDPYDFTTADCLSVQVVEQEMLDQGKDCEGLINLDGLRLMPDGMCTDEVRDGDPELCRKCSHRGTVFDSSTSQPVYVEGPRKSREFLKVEICECALKLGKVKWRHNNRIVDYPTPSQPFLICITDETTGTWVCIVTLMGSQEKYSSRPFFVQMQEDYLEPQEETPSPGQLQNQGQPSRPLGEPDDTARQASRSVAGSFHYTRVSMLHGDEQQPEEESERCPKSEYSRTLHTALQKFAPRFLDDSMKFNDLAEQGSPGDHGIQGIIRSLKREGLDSRETFVGELFERLTDDDTVEPETRIRQCDLQVYSMIQGLLKGKEYHRHVGHSLLRDLPLPPYVHIWSPKSGSHRCHLGCAVDLTASVFNADQLEWRHNGLSVRKKRTLAPHDSNELTWSFRLCENTIGDYCCVAWDQDGITSRTPAISFSVDYALPSYTPSGAYRCTPTIHETLLLSTAHSQGKYMWTSFRLYRCPDFFYTVFLFVRTQLNLFTTALLVPLQYAAIAKLLLL
jgi:hypothetical protein